MSDAERIWSRARRRGDIPVSLPLVRAVGSVGLLACLPALGVRAWNEAESLVLTSLRLVRDHPGADDAGRLLTAMTPWSPIQAVLVGALPAVGLLGVLALVSGLLQTKGWFAPTRGPSVGSRTSVASLLPALVVSCLLLGVAGWRVGVHLDAFTSPVPEAVSGFGRRLSALLMDLAWVCGGLVLALGALDVLLVRWRWRQRNELDSREERRERRQRELSPEVRAALRHAHREALGQD